MSNFILREPEDFNIPNQIEIIKLEEFFLKSDEETEKSYNFLLSMNCIDSLCQIGNVKDIRFEIIMCNLLSPENIFSEFEKIIIEMIIDLKKENDLYFFSLYPLVKKSLKKTLSFGMKNYDKDEEYFKSDENECQDEFEYKDDFSYESPKSSDGKEDYEEKKNSNMANIIFG